MHRLGFLTCFILISGGLAQEKETTPSPPADEHHAVRSADRRADAARLTESVAGSNTETSAEPIPINNFIDRHIFGKMERDGVPHAPLADDATFIRRLHLDLTGRIPDEKEARAFIASEDPGKRAALVDKLVGSREWSDRWTYWLLDLWRASQNRIGWDGRNLFHAYVQDALRLNQPYNELVQEMITAKARSNWYVGPSSYLVRWAAFSNNCTEIMHEDTADDITVSLFKHFMGIDLQCVSCHDGANHLEKINTWLTDRKRQEFWAQAAFFGETRVMRRIEQANTQDEYLIDDKERDGYRADAVSTVRVVRMGEGKVEPAFLFTGEKPDPNKPLREELARMFTADRQFARATVNRFWAELMGVGIVDPVEGFDLNRLGGDKSLPAGWDAQPSHPELLEALADDFIDSGYDLQHLFRTITKSSAYQLSSSYGGDWNDAYAKYYARKFVRRLSAEQVHDAIVKATNLHTEIQIPHSDDKVRYLVQTRGPADTRFARNLDRQTRKDLQFFLESFGQANREFNEPSLDGSIIQAALMMNSKLVKEKSKAEKGSRLATLLRQRNLSGDTLVESLFWSFLTRSPDEQEKDQALALIAEMGPEAGGEDLQWILMNKVEFLFNR